MGDNVCGMFVPNCAFTRIKKLLLFLVVRIRCSLWCIAFPPYRNASVLLSAIMYHTPLSTTMAFEFAHIGTQAIRRSCSQLSRSTVERL